VSEQPEHQQQPDDPVQAAYEAALSDEPRDALGLPKAAETTSIGNKSVAAAEQEARAQLAAIERLKGSTEQPTEQPAEPDQPADGPLSDEALLDRFFGGGEEAEPQGPPLTEEEIAYLQQQEAQRQLDSGELAEGLAQVRVEMDNAVTDLERRIPGTTNPEFHEALEPIWEGLIERHPGLADDSRLAIEQVERAYERLGGDARFATPDVISEHSLNTPEGRAYAKALGDDGVERDSFGFPVGVK
jgi:hypothetical protein